jgi:prepilin-type N-terminal cleavage/methylation domain-containing protein
MNTRHHFRKTKPAQAFTVMELIAVIAILLVLAAVLYPILQKQRRKPSRVECSNNVMQICTGFFIWSSEHNGHFPMQVRVADGGTLELVTNGRVSPHFQAMADELGPVTRTLRCPEDKRRPYATNFSGLTDMNISYFLNMDATNGTSLLLGDGNITNRPPAGNRLVPIAKSNPITWTKDVHSERGFIAFGNGSVGLIVNRSAKATGGVGASGGATGSAASLIAAGVTNHLAIPFPL